MVTLSPQARHRIIFRYATRHNLSLIEAERVMARAKWKRAIARLEAKQKGKQT